MLDALVCRYRDKGVLVDANLLIGYLMGLLGRRFLDNCRSTKVFTMEDFELLKVFLARFKLLVTTPHVLTEVSNLSGRLPQKMHEEFRLGFRKLIGMMNEQHEPAVRVVAQDSFLKLGVADAAITLIAPGNFLVLTDESALAGTLRKRGVDVLNFNDIRTSAWQKT